MKNYKYIIPMFLIAIVGFVFLNDIELNDLNSNVKTVNQNPQKKPDSFKKSKYNSSLLKLAEEISLPTDDELKLTWVNEYGCSIENTCDSKMLTAKSFEEAIWMKNNGYITQSILETINNYSLSDFSKLADSGNISAKKLLSIDAMRKKKFGIAKSWASTTIANSNANETFGYRLLAEAYLLSNQPMLASVELKIASILGDYEATRLYENIMLNSPNQLLENTNKIAYSYLSSMLHTPVEVWDDNPRPSENGGG